MKRLSIKARLRFFRLKVKRERRRAKARKRYTTERRIRASYCCIRAPEVFGLVRENDRTKLLKFLIQVRESVIKRKHPTLLDFTNTKKLFSDGTLLFVAELKRGLHIVKNRIIVRCIPPRNNKVAQVFQQTDVFKLLKYRSPVIPKDADVVTWRFAHGNEVIGERYDDILGPYDGILAERIREGFYHGLTEAMTNCHHHAYINIRSDGLNISGDEKGWWMFSQEKDGYLSVVFCDLGVGIPETLPIKKPDLWKRLLLMGKPSDGAAIREAIEDSRSRTGKHYRGKGMKQLLEVVKSTQDSHLLIYSNRGCYVFHEGKDKYSNYNDSIFGTLIAWKVPVIQSPPEPASANH